MTIVTDAEDYDAVIEDMKVNDGAITCTTGGYGTAYARTAAYDAAIGRWFSEQNDDTFPRRFSLSGTRVQSMRYGENPHQNAAFYATDDNRPGVATATQIQGKELSYNNLNDTDAAFELAAEFETPAIAIIKHANPCGVALGDTRRCLCQGPEMRSSQCIRRHHHRKPGDGCRRGGVHERYFPGSVIALEITAGAREILAAKRNLRVLKPAVCRSRRIGSDDQAVVRRVPAAGPRSGRVGRNDLKIVSKREPSTQEIADMLFAFSVCNT